MCGFLPIRSTSPSRWRFRIGEQLTARVGRDLSVRSVQDTATYDSRHQSAGGSVTLGYGVAGSANYSQARVQAEHVSVSRHSGLRANDGGRSTPRRGTPSEASRG
jgi:filamentous hemagglutinin